MYTLSYKNTAGQIIDFTNEFKIIKFEGFGGVDADVQSQKAPYQDGSTHIDTLLSERTPYLEFMIVGDDWDEVSELRRLVSSIFNPKVSGTLTLMQGGNIFIIDGVPDHIPFFPDGPQNQSQTMQRVSVDLICHNPYWRSIEQISEPMTAYIGLFVFPVTFPTYMGEVGSKQIFNNDGDVETPVIIEFKGPATNPKVTNLNTGEFMKINRELSEGDTLIVNTARGNEKEVSIVGPDGTKTNVINWMDKSSSFFYLGVGENQIEYSADAGQDNAVVGITWRNRYLGV